MLMINALVSWNVMVNILPSLSLSLSPPPPPFLSLSLFLSVSLPTWALWWESTCRVSRTSSVSFFSSDWRGSSGWLASCSPSWSSSCAARVSVHAHTHARILYTHTHTHAYTVTLGWSHQTMWASSYCQTSQSNPHGCMSISNYCAQKNVTLTCVFCSVWNLLPNSYISNQLGFYWISGYTW